MEQIRKCRNNPSKIQKYVKIYKKRSKEYQTGGRAVTPGYKKKTFLTDATALGSHPELIIRLI